MPIVASVEMKARGATRGTWPQPREVLLCSPSSLASCQSGTTPPPREGLPKHWVRSEDSTAAIPLSPSLPSLQDPASPQWFGPWELAACGGIRISGKKLGAVFSVIVKTRSSNVKTYPLSHEHIRMLRTSPGKEDQGICPTMALGDLSGRGLGSQHQHGAPWGHWE